VKHQHIGVVPGVKEYMAEWIKHWGNDGALSDAGMIPMPKSERDKYKAAMTNLPVLTTADLK
jgi:phosphate transport system substrate-binding protein